jgi:hypothetical protein
MVKLAKKGNTGVLQYEGRLIVTYHHTTIVECGHNGIILNSGGWYTLTTKQRMNQASEELDLGFRIHQEDFLWYVTLRDGKVIPFRDGMVIKKG